MAQKSGRIHRGPDGLYDVEEAMRDFEATRSHTPGPGRGHTGEDGVPLSLTHWKTKSEREGYLKRRLERHELQGSLIRRDVAERTHAELAALIRSHLEGIGGDLRDDLAAEDDPRKCGDMVDAAIRAALNAAADRQEELDAEVEAATEDEEGEE